MDSISKQIRSGSRSFGRPVALAVAALAAAAAGSAWAATNVDLGAGATVTAVGPADTVVVTAMTTQVTGSVLVGTAYIEIAWAALQVLHPGAGLDMRALSFGEAMVFQDAAAREVRIELLTADDTPAGAEGARYEFRVYSRSDGATPWQEHARASLSVLQQALPALAPEDEQPAGVWQPGRIAQAGAVDFGPRWHNLQRMQFEGRSGTEVTFTPSAETFTMVEFDYKTLEHRLRAHGQEA